LPIADIQRHESSFGRDRLLGGSATLAAGLAGCGSGFGGTTSATTRREASGGYFGEYPDQQATSLRIDGGALAAAVEARTGRRLRRESDRTA
jgi:hypothetical protein